MLYYHKIYFLTNSKLRCSLKWRNRLWFYHSHFCISILPWTLVLLECVRINLDEDEYNKTRHFKLYQSANLCNPSSFPFFHLTTRPFCFRLLLVPHSPRFTRREISQNFYVNPVFRAYRPRDAHSFARMRISDIPTFFPTT